MAGENLKYTRTHEWMAASGTRRKVGITDFAQHQLGDIVFVDFPPEGKAVAAGDEVCVIESCKATSGIYAPVAGTIVGYNRPLADSPEVINQSPYAEGWLFEIEVNGDAEAGELMDAAQYESYCQQDH